MSIVSDAYIVDLIVTYGYVVIAVIVGLESMGFPLPGETTLVIAALYAGTTGNLDVGWVIAAAVVGAVVGDNIGYLIGRFWGYGLLLRHGSRVGIGAAQIKVGQYLFLRHGPKVVFFGRFIAILRVLAAVLAGANRMPWRSFLVANVAGGIAWASVFGLGAFFFGDQIRHLPAPFKALMIALGLVVFFGSAFLLKRHYAR